MGKKWDYDVPSVEIWRECLRVLKPGGHLLSFAGTRTQHRMAVNIEDAGFEIRDMLAWVYGCLSFDTEVLTEKGFRRLRKLTQYDRIAVYDTEKNIYKWERPQRWNIYQVNEDTAYRIKSDYTDQIVSRNHRCLVEREGKLIFIQAEELNDVEYVPTLSGDFLALQKGYWKLLLSNLLWKSQGLVEKLFGKWQRKEMSSERTKDGEKSSLERWCDLFSQARKLQADKVCAVSEAVFADGTKRRLCNGTSFDFSQLNKSLPIENGSSASYQSQPAGQSVGKSNVIYIKQGTQITRRARIEKITYSGIIFCPTVSTGAFVARRNGQIFITGNSGFPKSLNIGKKVDQLQGNEREDLGVKTSASYPDSDGVAHYKNRSKSEGTQVATGGMPRITKGTSQWEGWGTALKPALEPITVARKPLEKGLTVAENCLKWGVGGIDIDGCRVAHNEPIKVMKAQSGGNKVYGQAGRYEETTELKAAGRFPANLIHDGSQEVLELFPMTGGGKFTNKKRERGWCNSSLGDGVDAIDNYGDFGSAARFFYCAKASKAERNAGCEGLEEKAKVFNGQSDAPSKDMKGVEQKFTTQPSKNFHPTVKPVALMEYLVKLVTREGQTVLDPFAGSGTTGIACKNLNRNAILIEREAEYVEIAKCRIAV
jgi:site-specific DNA-methyltransferase (adenine-specific)